AQIDAGAQAVQLFDSWVGCLSPSDYRRYVMPHTKAIFDKLPKGTPAIHFGTGNPELYPAIKEAGGDVIGIDWRISLDDAWSVLGDDVALGIMPQATPAQARALVDHVHEASQR
ncbi:MAG: uroporphyrinogen decarboxylase, partial [Deltaproteobacteria bacterium]|nr:uroporphyrinogen decarboxylase [Deltaproteobacteria bacterium]